MKFALIDFDGTLSEGYVSMSFLNYLYVNGAYNVTSYNTQMRILDEYKKNLLTYSDWCGE